MRGTYTVFSSDPTGKDLVVIGEDGTKIENITDISIRGEGGHSLMTMDLTLVGIGVNVKVVLDTVTFLCPRCGEYQSHDCEGWNKVDDDDVRTLGGD